MTQIGTSPTSSENSIAGDDEGVSVYEDEFMTTNGGVKVVAPLESINWDSAVYTTQLDETAEQIAVVRSNGVITYIDSNKLKPGMIVRLAQRDKLPADVLIIGGDGGKMVKGIDRNPYGRQSILIDTHAYDGAIGYDTFKECLLPDLVNETNVNDLQIKVNGYNSSAVLNIWFGAATINGEQYIRSESDTLRDQDICDEDGLLIEPYTGLAFKEHVVSLPCHIQSHVALINPSLVFSWDSTRSCTGSTRTNICTVWSFSQEMIVSSVTGSSRRIKPSKKHSKSTSVAEAGFIEASSLPGAISNWTGSLA